MIVIMIQV